jgi:hypothetical protein
MSLFLGSLGSSVHVLAESDGLWLRLSSPGTGDLTDFPRWPSDAVTTEDGKVTALEIGQLLEQGLADTLDGNIQIPYSAFSTIRTLGLQTTTRWTDWSPFMLSVSPHGDFGRPDFTYQYRFFFGAIEVKVERVGYFVRRAARSPVFHLDDQTFALLKAMDRFNGLPPGGKSLRENWVTFSVVKGCAREVGAALDVLLQSNEVVVPSRIALKIHQHDDGCISFVPRCSGVPDAELEKAFLALPSVEGVYSVDLPTGGRLRVVLDDEQQEVLRRMKRAQRLRGEAKREAIQSPEKYFDGVLGKIDLPYGRRVVGIGEFPFVPVSAPKSARTGLFDGVEREVPSGGPVGTERPPGPGGDRPTQVSCRKADDSGEVRIDFADGDARRRFQELVRSSLANGKKSLEYDGTQIRIDDELAEILLRPPTKKAVAQDQARSARPGRYLLIYTNEDDLKPWDEEAVKSTTSVPEPAVEFSRPDSLLPDVTLKAHQEKGVQWLQTCTQLRPHGRRGVLLADDMGLGKTLQVLTYLAWAIERGRISPPGGDPDTAPWRPILIVAPLILVENGTWEKEIQQFFKNSGSTFDPIRVLHGTALDEFRAEQLRGRETQLGSPTLDPAKLMRYRLLITNYETIKNYQHSFAQTIDGKPIWSIVVTDEAQEFKTPNTKVSHAIKALEPDFHIACTGTPLENRLLDIWNIFDALQPGLLGTAKEFTATYEGTEADSQPDLALTRLKDRLLFGRPNAFLVRREKSQVLDLPAKREVRLVCDMSADEVETHLSFVAQLRQQRQTATHLGILHRLSQLYQHPALVNDDWSGKPARDLVRESAKLRSVIQELHRIRQKREKAIVFARFVTVQQLLAYVLSAEFDLNVKIINGATARGPAEKSSATTRRAKETRSRLLADFKAKPGFNVLILSPFVAGVGLNITEANHVFHYGRWWNPAVESQATDRAYRIGQEKEVTVYFPTLRDASGRLGSSFDECLDQLLQRKSVLARDFLRPLDGEDSNAKELCDSLLRDRSQPDAVQVRRLDRADVDRLAPADFEALIACIYEASGFQTVLTSQSNDGGADVVAIGKTEAWLLQAKHSAAHLPTGPEAVDDLLAAQTVYQNAAFRPFKMAVVSNAKFSAECARRASQCGISLIDGAELLRRLGESPVTMGEVVAREVGRAGTFSEGVEAIRRIRC